MLNFCSLYSGSSGNSLFVETENTKVLVDVGLSCKKIEEALSTIEKILILLMQYLSPMNILII